MKKIYLGFLLILVSISLFADGVLPLGSGTEADPYQIATLDNLLWVSTNNSSWSSHFIQTADIDASDTENWNGGEGFSPMGSNSHPFSATYNGQNYEITNIYINRPATTAQSLIRISDGANFSNLCIVDVDITGTSLTSVLISIAENSVINNCYSSGTINGLDIVGGLIGRADSCTITNSNSTVNCNGEDKVGGLIGEVRYSSLIDNCFTTGIVSGDGAVGGLIGSIGYTSTINNCYSISDITAQDNAGGLAGDFGESEMSGSYFAGSITSAHYAGG
ncbi:MAG: hypothetical protein JXR56_09605, partial [Candidatus Cloacimonetes bacterium]|nr:hypothetical protein [Candidatus Cloacimonadota bacterium]